MKKTALLLLLCICLLLACCTAQTAPQPIQPEPEPVQTEPEPTPPAAETADTVASQEEQTQERPALPVPSASMFSLAGREAVLYDAAVAQRYPRSDNDIVLPSLCVYGSFSEDGKTVVICDLHYDFYYDYTGPGWAWNSGAMNTYLRAELETQDGAEVCTGFAISRAAILATGSPANAARLPCRMQMGRGSCRNRPETGSRRTAVCWASIWPQQKPCRNLRQ